MASRAGRLVGWTRAPLGGLAIGDDKLTPIGRADLPRGDQGAVGQGCPCDVHGLCEWDFQGPNSVGLTSIATGTGSQHLGFLDAHHWRLDDRQ